SGQDSSLPVGPAFGGVYWLLTVCLPTYVQFRYPAKWWVVVQIGLAVLAGLGLHQWTQKKKSSRRLERVLFGVAVLSGAAWVVVQLAEPAWQSWLEQAPPDALFGPLDVTGARRDLSNAVLHALVVAGAGLLTLRMTRTWSRAQAAWLLVMLTSVDLLVAHRQLISLAPEQIWGQPSVLAADEEGPDGVPPRLGRSGDWGWWPATWAATSSFRRQDEIARWEVATSYPKHHLSSQWGLVGSLLAVPRADYEAVMAIGRAHGAANETAWEDHLRCLGVVARLGPTAGRSTESKGPSRDDPGWRGEIAVNRLSRPWPRAWMVDQVEFIPPVKTVRRAELVAATESIWYPQRRLRDWQALAIVEVDDFDSRFDHLATLRRELATDPAVPRPVAEVTWQEVRPNQLVLRVTTDRPGLLVMAEQFDDGWQARRRALPAGQWNIVPIWRTNRIMRGIAMPAGQYELELSYRPPEMIAGAWITGLGWLAWLSWTLASKRWGSRVGST
ncbi:MAG: hypothetical protein KDA60_10810, partial [Planctomycetales bacterium]|nr:hypothetical protein [Planctomycetales bacterium]